MITIENTSDIQLIHSVIRQIHDEYWNGHFAFDPVAFAEKLAKFGECLFAVDDTTGETLGGVFGYCNNTQDKIAYISFLGRVKSATKGTGLLLHQSFAELASSRGMECIRLEVSKDNSHAMEFYHRLGYVQVEDRGGKLLLELPIEL